MLPAKIADGIFRCVALFSVQNYIEHKEYANGKHLKPQTLNLKPSMSVLVFIDHIDGHIKKASLEALSYGAQIAQQTGDSSEGIVLGSVTEDLAALGQYGVKNTPCSA